MDRDRDSYGRRSGTILDQHTGPVIPLLRSAASFQPFPRLDTGRTRHADGHGLGPAIVYAITHAHGADLTAHARLEGGLHVEAPFLTLRQF